MAREPDPVSDETIAALREEMAAQRRAVREALADDLGGPPRRTTRNVVSATQRTTQ